MIASLTYCHMVLLAGVRVYACACVCVCGVQAIVAAPLTVTGSIGVVAGKFNLQELYERVGYSKTLLSRGKFAELAADNRCVGGGEGGGRAAMTRKHASCSLPCCAGFPRPYASAPRLLAWRSALCVWLSLMCAVPDMFHMFPVCGVHRDMRRSFTPEEAALWEESAQYAYRSFRDKAAASRNMPIEDMQVCAGLRLAGYLAACCSVYRCVISACITSYLIGLFSRMTWRNLRLLAPPRLALHCAGAFAPSRAVATVTPCDCMLCAVCCLCRLWPRVVCGRASVPLSGSWLMCWVGCTRLWPW